LRYIKCKQNLISLQHRAGLRAMKSHIQNSTNNFGDNVIERYHCTYNPLDETPVNVSLHNIPIVFNG